MTMLSAGPLKRIKVGLCLTRSRLHLQPDGRGGIAEPRVCQEPSGA